MVRDGLNGLAHGIDVPPSPKRQRQSDEEGDAVTYAKCPDDQQSIDDPRTAPVARATAGSPVGRILDRRDPAHDNHLFRPWRGGARGAVAGAHAGTGTGCAFGPSVPMLSGVELTWA